MLLTTNATNKGAVVHVIDNDETVRDSYALLLSAYDYIVYCHESAEGFLRTLAANNMRNLGCILLDLKLAGLSGLELQRILIDQGFKVPISFVAGFAEVSQAVEAIKLGAFDFLQKPIQNEELCNLVAQMLTKAQQDLDKLNQESELSALFQTLTSRENEILDHIIAGKSNRQIGEKLNISIKTVEQHRANIMDKLKVKRPANLLNLIFKFKGTKAS